MPLPTPEKGRAITPEIKDTAKRLADFILLTQGTVILNLSPELNKAGVSFPQFFLLTYLLGEEFVTMSDIAKKMGHSTAAATGLVDRLEKKGYIERKHSETDRRKIMVSIVQKGTEFVTEKRQEIGKELHRLIQNLDVVN